MPSLHESFPALYRSLLPRFFQRLVPPESKATCERCTMCSSQSGDSVESVDGVERSFRPDTKCCTYHPRLPNYLVGALLADPTPEGAEGRRRVREKLETREGITPQWLDAPAKYSLLYKRSHRAFGRSRSLLCPFYEQVSGHCTIWAHREAVCSTYFCRYVAGGDGQKLWLTVKTYLSLVEIQLSRYALLQVHPEFVLSGKDRVDRTREVLTLEELEGRGLPEPQHRALWGEWTGREAELYVATYEHVRALSAAQVEQMLGLDGTIELGILDRLHQAAVATELPKTLTFNPAATVKWLADGSVALGCYSELDALALPREAHALLVEFDGKSPVTTTRELLRTVHQADLSEDVLLVLYQHRILVAPDAT